MSNYTAAELQQGRDAWCYLATFYDYDADLTELFRSQINLPMEVVDPRTGAARVVLVRDLTPEDMRDWLDHEYAKAIDRGLADLQDKEF